MKITLLDSVSHCVTPSFFKALFLSILFGMCYALPFIQHNYYLLSWVAFVPLLFATHSVRVLHVYFLSLVGGLLAIVIGKYWIYNFVVLTQGFADSTGIAVAAIYWLYSAHYVVLVLLAFRFLSTYTNIYKSFLFPLCLCITDLYFPLLFSVSLADTQAKFTIGLQAIDITGSLGLVFLIGWFNYGVFAWLKRILKVNEHGKQHYHHTQYSSQNASLVLLLPLFSALAAWFGYGFYSYSVWEHQSTQMPFETWGMVQSNERPNVEHTARYPGYSDTFPPEMDMTERLAAAGAELIIWPEGQGRGYLEENTINVAYHRQLTKLNIPLLFHDFEVRYAEDNRQRYNAAIFITPGQSEPQRYNKIKRVPFGEYMPDFATYTGFSHLFNSQFNIEDSYLTAGVSTGVFKTDSAKDVARHIVPLICYETTFPFFVARAISNASNSGPASTVLAALSNDGWFSSRHQANQHILSSILRSVENRVPLVHITNNGPSIATNPSGSVIFESPADHAGGFLFNVPIMNAPQPTLFNRFPYAMPVTLSILFTFCLLVSLGRLYRKQRTLFTL